jgi:hypothetical protein
MKRIALSERFAFVKFVSAASRLCGGAAAATSANASAASSTTMTRQMIRIKKNRRKAAHLCSEDRNGMRRQRDLYKPLT